MHVQNSQKKRMAIRERERIAVYVSIETVQTQTHDEVERRLIQGHFILLQPLYYLRLRFCVYMSLPLTKHPSQKPAHAISSKPLWSAVNQPVLRANRLMNGKLIIRTHA